MRAGTLRCDSICRRISGGRTQIRSRLSSARRAGLIIGLGHRLRVYPFSDPYFKKIFSQGVEMKMYGFRLNSLYSFSFTRDTNCGIFFATSELRRRWEAWAKENLWVSEIKKRQKKSLLKE